MIGEGTQSTNQRRHLYVQDRVEVGFFTDPSVCVGCKACEVACKECNEVPDDGFTWLGNSYDITGRLGASTWRHVLFLEQDRRKGEQLVGSLGDGEDPFRWVFQIGRASCRERVENSAVGVLYKEKREMLEWAL